MLLDPATSLLLLVDLQVRLMAAMPEDDPVIFNASILVRAARELGVPIIASEQYPAGLGPTVAPVAQWLKDEERHEKIEFSCLRNPALASAIDAAGRQQVVLAGAEAHVCVLQTAHELLARGRTVYVAADAIVSRNPLSREIALRRMAAAGVIVITAEMAAFEWVGSADNPRFKAVSALVRQAVPPGSDRGG